MFLFQVMASTDVGNMPQPLASWHQHCCGLITTTPLLCLHTHTHACTHARMHTHTHTHKQATALLWCKWTITPCPIYGKYQENITAELWKWWYGQFLQQFKCTGQQHVWKAIVYSHFHCSCHCGGVLLLLLFWGVHFWRDHSTAAGWNWLLNHSRSGSFWCVFFESFSTRTPINWS